MASSDDILLEEQFAQKRMSAGTFWRLVTYLRPYKRTFVLNLSFTVLATVSQLLGPKFIQIGIDRYLANLLLGWGLSVGQVKSAIAIGQGAINDLRLIIFEHIQRLSLSYFDQTNQGRIINRADGDVDSLDRIMTWGANQMLSSLLTL